MEASDSKPIALAAPACLDAATLDCVLKLAFFVARCGEHLEDMTRERRKTEPRLKWLWNKKGPEYVFYKAKVRQLRGHLKTLRQQGTEVWIEPDDDHTVTYEKLSDVDKLAKLDVLYTRREQQCKAQLQSKTEPEPEEPGAEPQIVGPSGHHLQDFIPQDVMAEFLQKSNAVLNKSPHAMPVAQSAGPAVPDKAGLGAQRGATHDPQEGDDEFTLYQKRMMLAYKYRPNPLGNPRTPYY